MANLQRGSRRNILGDFYTAIYSEYPEMQTLRKVALALPPRFAPTPISRYSSSPTPNPEAIQK